MKEHQSSFCFKGDRKYVHGTDIFNELNERVRSASTIDFVLHGVTKQQLIFSDQLPAKVSNVKVVFIFGKNDEKHRLYGTENGKGVRCRYDYSETNIYQCCELSIKDKNIVLLRDPGYTFIEKVVAMNKKLLETLFSEVVGKWYMTRIRLNSKSWKQCSTGMTIEFKDNLHFRLVRSEIFDAHSVKIGELYFSLVKEME